MFEIKEILDLAVRLEKNGETTYRAAIRMSSDEGLQAMLAWMAAEEARHAEWFSGLKADLASGRKNPFMEEMSRQVFEDLVGGQSFSLREVDFSKVSNLRDLISIFIEFEQDTILFYELIAPFIEVDETRRYIETIISEEHRHVQRLQQVLSKGQEMLVPAG